MNTSDKTGEKLVQSIRKTKTTGSASRSKASATAGGTTPTAAPVKKSAPARKTRTVKKTAAADKDLYQSGRRVWPD